MNFVSGYVSCYNDVLTDLVMIFLLEEAVQYHTPNRDFCLFISWMKSSIVLTCIIYFCEFVVIFINKYTFIVYSAIQSLKNSNLGSCLVFTP